MPSRARTPASRQKHNLSKRAWRSRLPEAKRKELSRRSNLWRRYRITPEQFDALLTSQGNCCAICRSPDPRHQRGWRVDHNHVTKKVRGILCNHCNVAIGMAGEDADVLFKIAVYLKVHS